MRTLKQALVLMMAGGMLTPALSAQSIWQKMKQAAEQANKNAQAQSHQAHSTQQTAATAPPASARDAQPAADSNTSSAAAAAPVNVDSPAMKALYRKLDVGGVQLGMTPQEAQAALLGRNRAFVKGQAQPFVFTDLPNVEFTSHVIFAANDETVTLGLTIQPMQPEVLSIGRGTKYEIDHQPIAKNTVAALLAKYGPVSILEDTPSADEIFILWIYDGEGNLVSKARAEKIRSCGVGFKEPSSGYISHDALIPHWDVNCAPYTILKAILKTNPHINIVNSRGQSLPPGLMSSMSVEVTSNPLFTKNVEATRQMVLDAKAANLQKNKKAAEKNVPTL